MHIVKQMCFFMVLIAEYQCVTQIKSTSIINNSYQSIKKCIGIYMLHFKPFHCSFCIFGIITYQVFGTNVMVTVAKSFEAPIKRKSLFWTPQNMSIYILFQFFFLMALRNAITKTSFFPSFQLCFPRICWKKVQQQITLLCQAWVTQ